MRLVLRVLAVLCVLAYLAGVETRRDAPYRVPVSRVAAWACKPDRAVYATTTRLATDVFQVTCSDGVVVTAPSR